MNGFILRQCPFTYIKVKKKKCLNWNLNICPLANDASALITELLRSIILIDSHINASTVPLSTECIKERFCKKGLNNTILFFTYTDLMHHIRKKLTANSDFESALGLLWYTDTVMRIMLKEDTQDTVNSFFYPST